MRSLVVFLLFLPSIYSMSIRRCDKTEEETWGLRIGLCILARDFVSEKTSCSVHRPDVGGGLITEGNGFRVVVHDQCDEPKPFIITTTKQTHFGSSRSYIEFSNGNTGTPESIPKCARNIFISVYCDQVAGELNFEEYNHIESNDISIRIKYDSSCINYMGVTHSFMTECVRRMTSWDRQSCDAIDAQTIQKYLRTCSNTKFDRSVYKRHMIKSKVLHAKTEL
ncbi:virulence factor [Raccoonpox virus]|uniref:Intracellular viral protein n=1 Tax=Raccoon poxvirus TaxID=10256 RepID=A0A0G3FXW9_RACVI|nr:Intracellular viral protein [Raccoonpox virus]AKJ93815.1 Intracellular viral protein [Raccoonpox virus]AOP31448.1 virulence factor [Raccoonpox virus]